VTTYLSVIVPVYNEENTLRRVISKLWKVSQVTQIIIVDDGSTDSSIQIISALKKKLPARFKKKKAFQVLRKSNGGKGSAVQLGLQHAVHEYVLIQDADCEYDPEDIPFLLEPIQKKKTTVVYGSRFLGPHSNLLFWHKVGNSLLNFVTNVLYDTTLSDMETCYKLLPTKLFRELDIRKNNFDMEAEITCKLLRRKVRIFEVPISYVGRDYSEGKKITWKDGLSGLMTIFSLRI
jgi:glycosyltransferase involved in cell wall biosynthesis